MQTKTAPTELRAKKSMHPICLWLPISYAETLDKLVALKRFPNRNEAIRVAVKELLDFEMSIVLRWNNIASKT
jgi:Arc/MetJ-type ribon-helix-helix transcriptional regulator